MLSHFSNNYHYNYDYNFINNPFSETEIKENDICLICLETQNEKNTLSKLSLILIKPCSCDGIFHDNCLELWNTANKSCPICRITINTNQELSENENYEYIQLFLQKMHQAYKISFKILSILSTLLFINICANMTFIVFFELNSTKETTCPYS